MLRRKYLKQLSEITGRNVISYYSGWLQKPHPKVESFVVINDQDKNGFMSAIHGLSREKGLDLILHTPGGEIAATESLIDYLKQMFGTNIRAIIPQLAMSGGTMIACACSSIVMGKQSSLGPVDPQIGGLAAHAVIEEFQKASDAITADPKNIPIWQPMLEKYPPTFIGECQKAIDWSLEMVRCLLLDGMLKGDKDALAKVEKIVKELGDHGVTKTHSRHLSVSKCIEIGLKIEKMEDNQKLQDAILSVHHATMLTLSDTPAVKIIENSEDKSFIQILRQK